MAGRGRRPGPRAPGAAAVSATGILAGALAVAAALPLLAWLTRRCVETRVPPCGRFVEVAGTRLHYQDRGEGPVVVLLHGLGGNLRHFHRLAARLSAHCRVIAVDSPGCGYSRRLGGGRLPLRGQAALLAAFFERLALEPALLVGHSLGGALALAVALDHPARVRGLVLLAGLSQPVRLKGPAIRSPLLQALFAWTLLAPVGLLLHRAALRTAFAPEAVPPDVGTAGGAWLGYRPGNFRQASMDMATAAAELAPLVPRYPTLGVPVAILFGRQDQLLDPAVHGERLAAALPRATLRLLDAGHMLPLTQVEPVAECILRALQPAR